MMKRRLLPSHSQSGTLTMTRLRFLFNDAQTIDPGQTTTVI